MQSTNLPYAAYYAPPKMNPNTTGTSPDSSRNQSPLPSPAFAESPQTPVRRNPHAYFSSSDRDPSKGQFLQSLDLESRSAEPAPPAYHDAKAGQPGALAQTQGEKAGFNPYPSPPAAAGLTSPHLNQQPSSPLSPPHALPIALQFQSKPLLSSTSTSAAANSAAGYFFQTPAHSTHPHSPSHPHPHHPHPLSPSHPHHPHSHSFSQHTPLMLPPQLLPPAPKFPLPIPPSLALSDVGFSTPEPTASDFSYLDDYPTQPQQQTHSTPFAASFPSLPPQPSSPQHHRYQSESQSYLPATPPSSGPVSSVHSGSVHSPQQSSSLSQSIDTTAFSLHNSLSSLSLAPSVTSIGNQPELTRVATNGSNSSVNRPASVSSKNTTAPVVRAVMDFKTAEVLSCLSFEDMPRCYVVAPPLASSSSSGSNPPFRILAPCQALGVRTDNKDGHIHFPEHPGYIVNQPQDIMKKHGTVLQHFANLACLVSGATESSFGKNLARNAERFLKNVKPSTKVPAAKDTIELSTGVDGTSLQIEKFMTEHLQLESIAQLMRDITGSNSSSDWSGGLSRIVSPGTGRTMWVCSDCFTGLQSGKYEWNDEQASLDDLIGYPDKSGVKSEAHLLNAVAIDVCSQMVKGQSRIKHLVLNISPTYFESAERKSAAVFQANQRLIQSFTKVLTEAHLTMVEIHAHQARDSELMDKDNIYLHVRRLFACFQIEYVKLSGLPFLLREKLPGFLNHAKSLSFDGVLVDNDKAVANMKKLVTENSDMEQLIITKAHMTSSGLKVICAAHKNLRRLIRLDLSRNRIDSEGIKELASMVLPTSLDLRFLDLSDNPRIGTTGCVSLLQSIWPASSHVIRQKNLVSLQLANTGFCDEAAKLLTRNIESPNGLGSLFNINLSNNLIAKPGLMALMTCVSQNASSSRLRKLSLGQNSGSLAIPGAMDFEVVHFFGTNSCLTHLSLSKISLGVVAQLVNLNKSLIALLVEDTVCVSAQDPNYTLSAFNSLCQSIVANSTLQDLKIRTQWSFWSIAFQSSSPAGASMMLMNGSSAEQEIAWLNAAGWMAVLESALQHNTVLRCFQMRGITNFEDELALASSMAPPMLSGSMSSGSSNTSAAAAAAAMAGGASMLAGSDIARTEGESKMVSLSQNIRMFLERNQVLHYGRKHGLEAQLVSQY